MKSDLKSKILVVLILILVISVNIAFFKQISYSEVYNNPYKEDNPKLNAPDIVIITPENKTYTRPMSGYYLGTYGFENDINGNDPQEWNDTSGTGCDCFVVDSAGDHNKVLKIYDNSNPNEAKIEVSLSYQTHGTIEYWVYGSMSGSPYDRLYEYIFDGGNAAIQVITVEGTWSYGQRGGGWVLLPGLPNLQAGKWQHIRIHFEMGSSGYMGLGPDQFELIVDGVSSGALDTAMVGSGIDKNRFFTITDDVGQNWYIDAFGYTGDVDYNIGGNTKEGLHLSFDNSTVLDWMVYSLDGQTNKTILGNTTITFPEDGQHTIQMFGNDSMGDNYESDVRYFIINFIPITLITPENKTYTGPMSGYYPGSYGFENDINGNDPQEWNDISGTGCDCFVVDSAGDHNKVLKIYDNSNPNRAEIEVSLPYQTHGTIEYWVYGSMSGSPYDRLYEYIFDGGNAAIQVITVDGTWSYGQRGGGWVLLPGLPNLQASKWQHIRIHFEMGSSGYMGLGPDQFELIVDGVSSGALDTAMVGSGIDKNKFFTITDDVGQNWYIDAFGYTGDVDYNTGDNLNKGLLLSYESSINFDWLGYSLDGQTNKTILGNTTIPFPEDGQHTIQVFGNDSMGDNYESDLRYLSVDANPPIISIISPDPDEFFGSTTPNFEIEVIEVSSYTTWYTIDTGITNITFNELTGTINQTEWDEKDDGLVIIQIYANDSWGFEGYSEVSIYKDTTAPVSSIYFLPHSGIDVVNESTSFTLSADDGFGSGVSFITYKINDSSWINYTGPFTLSNYPFGDILISYQAIDQVGNYETIQTLLVERTDTIAPISSISFTPYMGINIVNKSTVFTVFADDGFGSGVSIIRFKINNSSWIDYIGPFDLSFYEYGNYMITYQAIDVLNNMEDEHSIIVSLVEIPSGPSKPEIYGYNLWILIGIISVVSMIIIRKKFKN